MTNRGVSTPSLAQFGLIGLILFGCLLGSRTLYAQTHAASTPPPLRVHGVKIKVTDMDEALVFYRDHLGLSVVSNEHFPERVTLDGTSLPIILERTKTHVATEYPNVSQTILVFESADLRRIMADLQKRGIDFLGYESPEPYGYNRETGQPLGITTKIRDPFGNVHSLVEQQVQRDEADTFDGLRVYNVGFYLPDMNQARAFYFDRLGFIPMTEKYLPAAMPVLHADGSFGFMLHENKQTAPAPFLYPEATQTLIVFETDNLLALIDSMRQRGVAMLHETPTYIAFQDPFGNVSEVYEQPLNGR